MRKKSVPVLGPAGYATGPKEKLTYLFAHIFESRRADETIVGHTVSMQYLVAEYGHSPTDYTRELQRVLSSYLGSHFDGAEVSVTNASSDLEAQYTVAIDAVVYQDGIPYSWGHELFVDPVSITAKILKEISQ